LSVKLRAVGYIRTSTKKQKWSPSVQRSEITEWAKNNDIELVGIIEAIGFSGRLPLEKRIRLLEAIDIVKIKDADFLVTSYQDRLTRTDNLHEIEERLLACGARFISADISNLEKNFKHKIGKLISEYIAASTF
jgi:DNA invertase Pin-like site-specific DNA recombinase